MLISLIIYGCHMVCTWDVVAVFELQILLLFSWYLKILELFLSQFTRFQYISSSGWKTILHVICLTDCFGEGFI